MSECHNPTSSDRHSPYLDFQPWERIWIGLLAEHPRLAEHSRIIERGDYFQDRHVRVLRGQVVMGGAIDWMSIKDEVDNSPVFHDLWIRTKEVRDPELGLKMAERAIRDQYLRRQAGLVRAWSHTLAEADDPWMYLMDIEAGCRDLRLSSSLEAA